MKQKESWIRVAVGGLLTLMVMTVMGGCSDGRAGVEQEFQAELTAGVDALRAGDLDGADVHIAAAESKADGYHQQRQVESLARLSAGARAMMAGDAVAAKHEWSAIDDPRLNRQVRVRAEEVMDVQVPMTVTEEAEQ